jgi:hypothetical protein
MAQAHPRAFLPQAQALAGLRLDVEEPALSDLIHHARGAQGDLLAVLSEQDASRSLEGDLSAHKAEFLALAMALFQADQPRTIARCSHLREPFDPTIQRLVDLTTGWASCGCREQIRTPRPDDGRCNVCDEPPPDGVLHQARLTAGPTHIFRADVCGLCWDWIEPLYRAPAAAGRADRSRWPYRRRRRR